MAVVGWIAASLAAIVHVLFFCMESLWWTKPAVVRRFRGTEEEARITKALAFNQGFYNLFLAVGTLGGLCLIGMGHHKTGLVLVFWNCASMVAAAVVLVASSPRMFRGALIQGLPPLIALAMIAFMQLR
jgi:putative membrane protein